MQGWGTLSNVGRPSSYVVFFLGWMQSAGAGVDPVDVLPSDAGFGNDTGHWPPPYQNLRMPPGRRIQAEPGKLAARGADDWENFCGHPSGL
jgi:hypothetical protein